MMPRGPDKPLDFELVFKADVDPPKKIWLLLL